MQRPLAIRLLLFRPSVNGGQGQEYALRSPRLGGSIPPASSHLTAAGSATLGVRTPGRILLGPLGRVKPKMLPSASFQTGREPALSAFAGDALLGRRGKRR